MKSSLSYVFLAGLFASLAIAVVAPTALDSDAEYEEYQQRIGALPVHRRGYFHLADDGVARSLGPNNEVLGFVPASPAVLARVIAESPEENRAHLESVWKGVDGRNVADPWVIKPEHITKARDSGSTECRDFLDSSDIVLRSLSTPLWKRACHVTGQACTGATYDCLNFDYPADQCYCLFVDQLTTGSCAAR
ncbi:hypothetical protein ONZ43_g2091 [Nemania bipapillata]|uniref:Uncharacterized protein n=1 Tax=Nemania bipapillata TaxID=110536 RepID=A0ACC2J253_9PEZI|nr:hypothetical protein ONZ43_g2091 [Nemania bipapillata]